MIPSVCTEEDCECNGKTVDPVNYYTEGELLIFEYESQECKWIETYRYEGKDWRDKNRKRN